MGTPRKPLRSLSRIDNATAQRLLDRYLRIAGGMASAFPELEHDEVLSVGRLAILEAYLSYDASRGCAESTWVRKTVWWRLLEASRAAPPPAESLGTDPQRVNGASPEQQFWRATAVRAVARLSPRHQVLVSAWMAGETFTEAGATIGISGPLAHRETHKALAQLREILESSEMW